MRTTTGSSINSIRLLKKRYLARIYAKGTPRTKPATAVIRPQTRVSKMDLQVMLSNKVFTAVLSERKTILTSGTRMKSRIISPSRERAIEDDTWITEDQISQSGLKCSIFIIRE
jgi:hypothetical protein